MRKATVEYGPGRSDVVRVHAGRADGRPQPELTAVLFMGHGREVVVVGRDPVVQGADVLYRLDSSRAGSTFRAACDRGVVQADVTTGLALVKPPSAGVKSTHLRGVGTHGDERV